MKSEQSLKMTQSFTQADLL
jgi:DNA-binding MltR family transcriptional regulator